MSAPKIQIVCGHCGSANVKRDAWAEWDAEKQDWVLGSVFDDGHCDTCEGESSLEEMPLDQWSADLDQAHELDGIQYQAIELDNGNYQAQLWLAGDRIETIDEEMPGWPLISLEDALDVARKAIMKGEFS